MVHRRRLHTDHDQDALRCVVDATGHVIFASPAMGWTLGLDAKALVGKPVRAVLSVVSALGDDGSKIPADGISSGFYEVALMREGRDPALMQARIDLVETGAGRIFTVIWLDPDNKIKRSKDGDFKKTAQEFASFVSDASVLPPAAKPQTQVSPIGRSDSELRHFLNITGDMMGVYDRSLSFVRVNPAFNRITGYSDAELRGFAFDGLFHAEDHDTVLQVMQKAVQAPHDQETLVDFECRVRAKDGSVRHVEWIIKGAGDYLYIVGRDVTDIKQHEAELQRREEQLSEAQKIGKMGHWLWEVDRGVMEWSDQIYNIFGVEKGVFIPTIENVNAMLFKRDVGRIYRSFQRALARKRDYEIEFRLRRPHAKDGSGGGIRYIRCEGRCKVDPKTGDVEALFGIMQDITDRTLHERALNEAKEAAESAYASKTRFLANMSHELRTPLNAIIGFSEMIQRQLLGPVGNLKYLDYVGGIRQSGEHLLDLINDILDMSKIEIGKYELHLEDVNVGKIIRLAIHMVEGRAHEEQVRLIAEDILEDVQIHADRRALMQVLLNLLSNAVKFTKAGGSVEVRCFEDLGGIAISVTDTGIGIPKEKLKVVTMPFEQVSGEFTRNHEGSGLGLAITKDLIEMHGGTLDIESELGAGTTVTVQMPLRAIDKKSASISLSKHYV